MTGAQIIAKVKAENFPAGSYIIFGAGTLAAVGIREAGDIDMFVTQDVIEMKKAEGWQFVDKGDKDMPLTHDCFELHTNWDFGHGYNPTFADLMSRAQVVGGVTFASLQDVREWKLAYRRPKDLEDIEKIDKYLAQNQN